MLGHEIFILKKRLGTMKLHGLYFTLLVMLSLLSACGGEDPLANPRDMVSINIMNEDHGKTFMGPTDIYMTRDNNLTSAAYHLCDFGQVLDLGHIEEQEPSFNTLSNQVAVKPNEGFIAFLHSDALRFTSGKVAIAIGTSYYRMWVDDWIMEKKEKVGATLNFALFRPKAFNLPKWGEILGAVDSVDRVLTVDLINIEKKECEAMLDTLAQGRLTVEQVKLKDTRKAQFKVSLNPYLAVPLSSVAGPYTLYIRCGNSYTATQLYIKP